MPELPEVETIRKQLTTYLPGLALTKLEFLDAKTGRFVNQKKVQQVIGKKIKAIKRRAKILLFEFENDYYLAFHLKMTGQVILKGKLTSHLPNKHTRAILYFSQDKTVFFQDMRRFGWLKIFRTARLDTNLLQTKLGPEPFGKEFSFAYFFSSLRKSSRPIKVFLLDQSKIAGVGNIYANEALFLAKVNPQLLAKNLNKNQARKLYQNLLEVLQKGIVLGGASDNSYLNAYGAEGKYQKHFLVYRRHGQACQNCQTTIKRISLAGRGTFYCPVCQSL